MATDPLGSAALAAGLTVGRRTIASSGGFTAAARRAIGKSTLSVRVQAGWLAGGSRGRQRGAAEIVPGPNSALVATGTQSRVQGGMIEPLLQGLEANDGSLALILNGGARRTAGSGIGAERFAFGRSHPFRLARISLGNFRSNRILTIGRPLLGWFRLGTWIA